MVRAALAVLAVGLMVTVPVQAETSQTIRYTTAFGGDGETGVCPNTATLGLLVGLFTPVTGYDWWNLCFGTPSSPSVHVRVVDDSGMPVRASLSWHEPSGDVGWARICGGEGVVALPVGATDLSVSVHAVPYSGVLDFPWPCPLVVPTGPATTGAVTVTYL